MHFLSKFLIGLVLLTAQILLGVEREGVPSHPACSCHIYVIASFISTWIRIQLKIVSATSEGRKIMTLVVKQTAAFFFLLRYPNQVTTGHELLRTGETPQGHEERRYDHGRT